LGDIGRAPGGTTVVAGAPGLMSGGGVTTLTSPPP
jgi:hypothetical protein